VPEQLVFMVNLTPGSTITDTSGLAMEFGPNDPGRLLAKFVAQGPQPNPLFHTYVQAHINTLLSRLVAADFTRAANAANPIHLTGTIHGTYSPVHFSAPTGLLIARWTETVTKAAGSISPLGQVTDWVNEAPFSGLVRGVQNQGRTIQAKQGRVFLSFDLQRAGSGSIEGEYTITGGSGAYLGETGSGHVQITWAGSRSRGNVTEIFS
jgi:hypothetical protein